VNAAGTHLLSLINEVLDLSKIEADKLELSLEPVDLARLIDEVIGTAGQLAEKNKNRLIVEARENLGALTADSMRLKQILLNLLSNACLPCGVPPLTVPERAFVSQSSPASLATSNA
jgi:adenylate cyclase